MAPGGRGRPRPRFLRNPHPEQPGTTRPRPFDKLALLPFSNGQLPVANTGLSKQAMPRFWQKSPGMFSRQLKVGYFTLEGLNSFATVYYFYYLYFFMQKAYGFDNKSNLMLAALSGATYAVTAWFAGRFAQRYGYFTALKTGFSIMVAALSMGLLSHSVSGHISSMVLNVVGMSFTWPTLEALVSEGEPRLGLQHMLGIYNVVWAATASIANFSGGAMLEKLGLSSLFYVPMAVHISQLGLTIFLESRARSRQPLSQSNQDTVSADPEPVSHPGVPRARRFLQMAWLANPFAYIAINTLVAVVPGVARRLELSTMAAGFCCSTWCFARFGAFALLWRWTQWHYRFRWLLLAYVRPRGFLRRGGSRPQPGSAGALTISIWNCGWLDLLFFLVLFDGPQRYQRGTRWDP